MPPRGRGRGAGPPGGPAGPRGAGPPRGRGGPPNRGRGSAPAGGPPVAQEAGALPATHVEAVGVKRPGFGRSGTAINILTNHFKIALPENTIYHYDDINSGAEVSKNAIITNLRIFNMLQRTIAPNTFASLAAYDGRKNVYAIHRLIFPNNANSYTFDVPIDGPTPANQPAPSRPPKVFKVTLKEVATINPTVVAQYLSGKMSLGKEALTTINALNVVLRMAPSRQYPFNVRSFFTSQQQEDLQGFGITLWRGYFQSVRPSLAGMLVNLDISTGFMYKAGELIAVSLEYLGQPNARALAFKDRGGTLDESHRIRLGRYLRGVKIQVKNGDGQPSGPLRLVTGISSVGADDYRFTPRDERTLSVAQYFQEQRNKPLQFRHVICAIVGKDAYIPFELCFIPPGQLYRHSIPQGKVVTDKIVQFSTMVPTERLRAIEAGVNAMSYLPGRSEYLTSFGMNVDVSDGPLKATARVLPPPTMRYGQKSKQPTVTPRQGTWNLIDKHFWKPATIEEWGFVVYENRNRFNDRDAANVIASFIGGCASVGIVVKDTNPGIFYCNAQHNVSNELRNIGNQIKQKGGKLPTIFMCVLPAGATDLYTAIKHFGDVQVGIATQCMQSLPCKKANKQYVANVLLKVNVKLGGINTVPDQRSLAVLTDETHPTCVMGADVIHPAPGTTDRPSFTALVTSIDSQSAKYVADLKVQTGRREMIQDLEAMVKKGLEAYISYRKLVEKVASSAPKRIIFYRDGVSEGEYQQVINIELPRIKAACRALNISPKITLVVVAKRHHVRFFPENARDGEGKSGNCPAGMVVDTHVTSPIEFDFFLLSHTGILGTSRPAHYIVLHDENSFNADSMQALSFALCHVYARATRSVSIPAPVYYADIVCARAKIHYSPDASRGLNFSESGETGGTSSTILQQWKDRFQPAAGAAARNMYFS